MEGDIEDFSNILTTLIENYSTSVMYNKNKLCLKSRANKNTAFAFLINRCLNKFTVICLNKDGCWQNRQTQLR